jgi:hypothetical protein
MVTFTAGQVLTQGKKTDTDFPRLGGPHGFFGHCGEGNFSFPLLGIEHRAFQVEYRRYNG